MQGFFKKENNKKRNGNNKTKLNRTSRAEKIKYLRLKVPYNGLIEDWKLQGEKNPKTNKFKVKAIETIQTEVTEITNAEKI